MKNNLIQIGIDEIDLPKEELRSETSQEGILTLASSIKKFGMLQPILVSKNRNRYVIVAGGRRYLAAKRANLATIPAIITTLKGSNRTAATLEENLNREDVNHIDVARYILKYKERTRKSDVEIAADFGYSPAWVSRHLRALKIPEELQAAVEAGHIDIDSATTLSRITAPKRRQYLLKFAVEEGASQATIRRWVQDELSQKQPSPSQSGRLDKVSPETAPTAVTFRCAACGQEKDNNDMILMRLCSECYQTVKKAIKVEKEGV